MSRRRARTAKVLQAVGLAVAFLLAAAAGESFGQAPAVPQQPVAPSTEAAILPEQVAAKAIEAAKLLRAFSALQAPSPDLEKIRISLPEIRRQIDLDVTDTSAILGDQPPLAALQAQQAHWQERHLEVSGQLAWLTKHSSELRDVLSRLTTLHATWAQTRDAAQAEKEWTGVLQQAETTLASIQAALAELKSREEEALELQGALVKELGRCDEALVQILKAQKSAVEGIFSRENPPIWSPQLWDHARTVLPRRIQAITRGFWLNIKQYLMEPSHGLPVHISLFMVLAVAACTARRRKHQTSASGIGSSSAWEVFDRPYSAALMVALLVATSVKSPTPDRAKDVLTALTLIPMVRLIRPVLDPRWQPVLFMAVTLYVVDLVRQSLGGAPLVEQAILIFESLPAMAMLNWLLDTGRRQLIIGRSPGSLRARSVPMIVKALMLSLLVGFLAATFGYTRLARLIAPAVIAGGVTALSLYVGVRVIGGAAAIALRSWPLQKLHLVDAHCNRIERLIFRALAWAAAVLWAARSLDYIGLLNPVLAVGGAILDLRLERGSISISIEDLLSFGLTVWAAYLLSAFIRFALQEEVYPRRGVARGMSYAYSRMIHYVILSLGFLVGLGVLGMDLTKVSVLAGAFGVGIGFGLQDVVNNFVCGLILLFERPVHVGDIVEVGGLQGEVRKIGIRASTVRTYQGADIIVPNSQFITANVTNWTLSDQLRRIDLPVGVNYGVAPQKVIELLETAAAAHKGILKKPPPQALFMGYGDSSINFELRAWTDQFGNWAQIRSELASAVYDAVYAAGMSFPFPQREVRVLGESGDKKTGALRTDGDTAPAQKR